MMKPTHQKTSDAGPNGPTVPSPMFMHENPAHPKRPLGDNHGDDDFQFDEEMAMEIGPDLDINYLKHAEKDIKRGFIRKVYSILCAQLVLTFGIILVTFYTDAKFFIMEHPALMFAAVGVIIVTMIGLACCPSLRRRYPWNFVFLGLFTLAESYLLSSVTCYLDADTVLIAIAFTILTFVALTLFAFQTKIDLTICSMVAFVGLCILIFFGFSMIWYRSRVASIVYASIGALIFMIFIVVDTQFMLSGKHTPIMVDEYIFAALNLYLDVINLFLYLLILISRAKD